MAAHFDKSRTVTYVGVTAAVLVAVLVAAAVAVGLHGSSSASASGRLHPDAPTTLSPAPMSVSLTTPSPSATGVDGSKPVVLTATAPLTSTVTPTITPAAQGTWAAAGDELTFTPQTALLPSTTYHVTVPAGTRAAGGVAVTLSASTFSFTTAAGSTLRLQELLSELGYLPFTWAQTAGVPAVTQGAAVYNPPSGTFTWTWKSAPSTLTSQWVAGQPNVLTRGAVMAFESDHQLTTDGIAGPEVWTALLSVAADPSAHQDTSGYTYALADQASSPQTLTVWHDGALVSQAPANTGIPESPTTAGTFPVYERLATQVMKGKNPDGTPYSDPVAWVAYFDGGQAVHYIARSSYGSYQSLGCVEVSYSTGERDWPYLTIGSLVTVEP